MHIKSFYDQSTCTFSYVVSDPVNKVCVIIDPVLNFNLNTGIITTTTADQIVNFIRSEDLSAVWVFETHIHADHLSAASYLKLQLGCRIAIGAGITNVLAHWVPIFNTSNDTPLDGSQFDRLLKDGDNIDVGSLHFEVMATPGHTPDSISYKIKNAVFVGDTIFMPYVGTARCDFPGGNASDLYRSIQKFYALDDDTRLFMCHDYPQSGNEPGWETTVLNQKQKNIMLNGTTSESEFIEKRNARDITLNPPTLLLASIQVNMRAGRFGDAESNECQYVKIPVK